MSLHRRLRERGRARVRQGRSDRVRARRGEWLGFLQELEPRTLLSIFTVSNTNDSGLGSLRQAILDANASGGADTIAFQIGNVGNQQSIQPVSALPSITDQVTIDGWSQGGSGYKASPLIEISGAANPGGTVLVVTGSNCVVRGLVINGFGSSGTGMDIEGSNDTVTGNYIGTSANGSTTAGGKFGVFLDGNQNTFANNLVSGNTTTNVAVEGSGNTLTGNIIGLNAAGTAPLPNQEVGLWVWSANNVVGGTDPSARNVIAGAVYDNVIIAGGYASGNTVEGNYIGTNAAGTAGFSAVTGVGIYVDESNNTIGGISSGARNVISGNNSVGILLLVTGVTVTGNYIGTDATGTVSLGGQPTGIDCEANQDSITGNVISGNTGDGIDLTGSNNTISGNKIGTDWTGTAAVPNGTNGIEVTGASNTIGVAGAGNLISGNAGDGIYLHGTGGGSNTIAGNLIGTNKDGTAALGNGNTGVVVQGPNNMIGGTVTGAGNVISGNQGHGVDLLTTAAMGNTVAGNFIGTDATGSFAIGNGYDGVSNSDGSSHNTIGGTISTARNVISGNHRHGVSDFNLGAGAGHDLVIEGNDIGTNAAGTAAVPNGANGVDVQGANNVIGLAGAGNVISGNSGNGITLWASGASNTTIQGNRIGTNAAGTAAVPNNGDGVYMNGNSNSIIGGISPGAGNLIGGNGSVAIELEGTAGITVQGNIIGLGVDGSTSIGNGGAGVFLASGTNQTLIGGTTAAARNVIANCYFEAVWIGGGSATTANFVEGNYLGTDVTGQYARSNARGVIIFQGATGNTIGGSAPGAGNLISGNRAEGVAIFDAGSNGNTIAGNRVGTNAAGNAAVPNAGSGVLVATANNTIGGAAPGAGNLISGNGSNGVALIGSGATGNTIAGNLIGTDRTGSTALPNGGQGVYVEGSNNTIGGAVAGAGNVISGNLGSGVWLFGSACTGNTVAGNDIGTDVTGSFAIGNLCDGIADSGGATHNTIGGPTAGAGNVVSASGNFGIFIAGDGDTNIVIQGNRIGTDATGTRSLGNSWTGIHVFSGPNTITGNLVSGGKTEGIVLEAPGNTVTGNRVGTDVSGTVALGNGWSGIVVSGGASTVSGNLVSGNSGNGIQLDGAGSTVTGNFIGTNAAGTAAVPNHSDGVYIDGADNTIGGTAAGAGNLISGNGWEAITLSDAAGTVIQGNTIGLAADGTTPLGNVATGVSMWSGTTHTLVGGTTPAARNVIGSNSGEGVVIASVGTSYNVVEGNYIGTDASGLLARSNSHGVFIIQGATNNTIGGSAPGAGNVISGNRIDGVTIVDPTTSGNTVAGNLIGTDRTGSTALPNSGQGVLVQCSNNTIGGTVAGAGNVISGNLGSGVWLLGSACTGNTVAGNFIGTDITGSYGIGNAYDGIANEGNASNNTIGGTAAAARNIISGNHRFGVSFNNAQGGPGHDSFVEGNFIGTNAAGTAVVSNWANGIDDQGPNDVIGGTTTGAGNLVSGNGGWGINLNTTTCTGTTVQGNKIGTDVTGTRALGNGWWGVSVNGAAGNTIGGSTAGAGNLISGNNQGGLTVMGNTAVGNVIQGNFVGTDINGTKPLGNGYSGILVGDWGTPGNAPTNTLIGGSTAVAGNLVSANGEYGVWITGTGATFNTVQGNKIGTDPTGTIALGNGWNGVDVSSGSNSITGNLISGNVNDGVYLSGSSNTLTGNLIGTNAAGTAALPNQIGVYVAGAGNTVGGTAAGARNLISGNGYYGVILSGNNATGNTVAGNYIGTNAAGTAAVANGYYGVVVAAPNSTIGVPGAGNVISGNGYAGLYVNTSGNTVAGNLIGTNVAGTAALPNATYGVVVLGSGNTIGGTAAGARNVISGNPTVGIDISSSSATGNQIQGNLIGTDVTGAVALGSQSTGIFVVASRTSITGNVVSGNTGDGVLIYSASNLVQGNVIGTNAAGTAAVPNGANGVEVQGSTNTIGGTTQAAGNLISGNRNDGVLVTGSSATGNLIEGNFIGTDVTGTQPIPNLNGVEISGAGQNTVGSSAMTGQGAGNLISGNADDGLDIESPGSTAALGDVVAGNLIGTDVTGTKLLANGGAGVGLFANGNTVGGLGGALTRNVISGNAYQGVWIPGGSANVVEGNFIGTDVTGTTRLGNGQSGVSLYGNASNNIIGGTVDAARNVISGNTYNGISALFSGTTGNLIAGNFIGTDVTGTVLIGNGWTTDLAPKSGFGIRIGGDTGDVASQNTVQGNLIAGNPKGGVIIELGSSGNALQGNTIRSNSGDGVQINGANNLVGGPLAVATNTIAKNTGNGVRIVGGSGNTVQRDSITGNTGQGIQVDYGADNNQAAPVVNTAYQNQGGGTTVTGTLVAAPGTTYRVEFYASDPAAGPGQTWLGAVNVTTNIAGSAAITFNTTFNAALGQVVTATATDPLGNTSPFSNGTSVLPAPVTGDVSQVVSIVRGGFSNKIGTTTYTQVLTLTNIGQVDITGPIVLVLDGLTTGVTLSGTTASGSPYVQFVPAGGVLKAGAQVKLTLQFGNPSKKGITYTTRVLAGDGPY